MKCPHCGKIFEKKNPAKLEWMAFFNRRELERFNEIEEQIENIIIENRVLHAKVGTWKVPKKDKDEQKKLRDERRRLRLRAIRRAKKASDMAPCAAQPPI